MKDMVGRIRKYLSEVWGEVRPHEGKVSWPNREEIQGSTWVVVVTVALIGGYLMLVDVSVGYVMKWILGIQ